MRTDPNSFSDLTIEKFLLKELSVPEVETIADSIQSSPELRSRIDHLMKSNQDILNQYPVDTITQLVLKKKDSDQKVQKTNRISRFWTFVPAPAIALVLLLIAYPVRQKENYSTGVDDRVKGMETAVSVYRKSIQGLEKLAHGAAVQPHDLVQLSYTTEKKKYGMIFSIDGNQQVTLHWSEKAGASPQLEPGREIALPSSFELDQAPLFEVFVLVTSESPFDVNQILNLAHSGRISTKTDRFEMELRPEFRLYAITLRRKP